MGIWCFKGGQIWRDGHLHENTEFTITVDNEHDRVIQLKDEDVITPGFCDIHAHVWAHLDQLGSDFNQIGTSQAYLLADGVTACMDAGSYGYLHWENANRLWRTHSLYSHMKFALRVLPGRYPTEEPEDLNVERTLKLFEEHRDVFWGFKAHHRLFSLGKGIPDLERRWLCKVREMVDQAHAPLMLHIAGSPIPLQESVDALHKGDIMAHTYNNEAPGARILRDDGNLDPALYNAIDKGVYLETSGARSHFSFKAFQKCLAEGITPDLIATDNNVRDRGKSPFWNIAHFFSSLIAAGLEPEKAFYAAMDKPRELLGFKDDYDQNVVVLEYVEGEEIFEDNTHERNVIKGKWQYKPKYGVYMNNCTFAFDKDPELDRYNAIVDKFLAERLAAKNN